MCAESVPYLRSDLPVEARVEDLLGRMTLAEKVDQLHQSGVGDTNPNNLQVRADEFRPTYGSFILNGPPDLVLRNALQRRAVESSRLGIPAIFGADVIHGYRLIFPIPLGQACAWDPDLVRRACETAATMAWAQGVDWTFAPMVDHCVDPRWGRMAETFGEAPFLGSVYAAASVAGYQHGPHGLAACLKHFVGYGASEGGRDYTFTEIAPQRLWELHLPPFDAGIRAGAKTVMSALNDLNGVPTTANASTLSGVLRHRWGFRGVVVSDWNAILQLIRQGAAADEAEAAEKALLAGVDLDMADGLYRQHLPGLVARGRVPIGAIDEAVRRVLRLKFEQGLFEHPYTEAPRDAGSELAANDLALAEEFAARSMVLLKNSGVLPFSPAVERIALIGPLADDGAALLGSWAQQGRHEEAATIEAGLRQRIPTGVRIDVALGCRLEGGDQAGFGVAVALARDADLVVLCLGESAGMSGENASRSTLRLPGFQEELALAVVAVGKPVVLLIVSGRPVELARVEPAMAAIFALWQPGTRGGAAIADLLLGRREPVGRLAVTWPRTTGQIPLYHQMRPRARPGRDGAYQDIETTPQYEFGDGLGYTTFSYSRIRFADAHGGAHAGGPASKIEIDANAPSLVAEVTVNNTGKRDGTETVLWFIRDPVASITRPLKELKHFEQASIPVGGSRVFRFEINPRRDLSFPNAEGELILEPGRIILFAGPEKTEFTVTNETP